MDQHEYHAAEDTAALSKLAAVLEHCDDEELRNIGIELVGDRPREYYRGLFVGLLHSFLMLQTPLDDDFHPKRRTRKRCMYELAMAAISVAGLMHRLDITRHQTTKSVKSVEELMDALQCADDPARPVYALGQDSVGGFVVSVKDRTAEHDGPAFLLKLGDVVLQEKDDNGI